MGTYLMYFVLSIIGCLIALGVYGSLVEAYMTEEEEAVLKKLLNNGNINVTKLLQGSDGQMKSSTICDTLSRLEINGQIDVEKVSTSPTTTRSLYFITQKGVDRITPAKKVDKQKLAT